MSNDTEFLRRYVEDGSEAAFTELVKEHLKLVYSAALREVDGDGALAEDVSQVVFTELSRKAPRLLGHPSIAGWLYTTVRYSAANLRRAEQRRRQREQEAQCMSEMLSDSPTEMWHQLRPVLDDALHDLNDADREALVLRFLEDRSLREVGTRLGVNENAVRMRVDRALDKLRGLLARRGITSTASSLSAALAIGAITAPPAALAATITSTVVAGGAATGSTLAILKIMSMSKLKGSLIGALVVAGITVPVWQQSRLQQAQSENIALRARQTELAGLNNELERLRALEVDHAELERLRQWRAQTEPELLRLRGMAGVARRANLEAEELRAQLKQQASVAGTNEVSGAVTDAMKQALVQQMDGRLSRMTATLNLSPEQQRAAREILMRQAEAMSAGMQQAFSGKFNKQELQKLGKEAGNPDGQIKALLTPDQVAAYDKYQREEAAHSARVMANSELVQMQSTLGLTPEQQDQVFAALYEVSFNQLTGGFTPVSTNQVEAMLSVLDRKTTALEPVLTPAQMEQFRKQQAIQTKLIKDLMGKMASGSK